MRACYELGRSTLGVDKARGEEETVRGQGDFCENAWETDSNHPPAKPLGGCSEGKHGCALASCILTTVTRERAVGRGERRDR